jgi:4-hydroxy-3-methylbut-2-enyl diphosphate reductase
VRLKETRELAKKVDVMIIVGGKNSANTTQLTKLSQSICDKVYHIETAEEIQKKWFKETEKVGITGGASTPQWLIDDVVKKIKEISTRR